MKLYNISVENSVHLAADNGSGIKDLTAAGYQYTMEDIVAGKGLDEAHSLAASDLPVLDEIECANVLTTPGKLVCIGLNYKKHAEGIKMTLPENPTVFSKFADSLVPHDAPVVFPPWETSYDYEAELVVVMGKTAWGVSKEEAKDYVFGYTCGNDLSCREPQMRTTQWLVGKAMPGFGPCGPCIVTADEFDPDNGGKSIRSYVNGELRQDGTTADMIFDISTIVSYVSHYIKLQPGDMIFTGTPSGVALEGSEKKWLKPGDTTEVVIEGIGTLKNTYIE